MGLLAAGLAGAAPDEPGDPTVSGHSVRVIRAALLGPPDPQAEQRAREFDERLMRTGQLGTLAVRPVEGAALERAQAIVARLAAAQPRRREPPWTVRVLASDPPRDSAFTAGGGFVYVHAALLERAESEDELAFVLAHEMAHTGLQHDRRQDADGLNRRLETVSVAVPGDETRPRLARVRQALLAAYSRADEQEADAVGAWLARRAGYDPGKAVSYFERQLGHGPTAGVVPGSSPGALPSPVTAGAGARTGPAALPVAGDSGALAVAKPGVLAGPQPGAGKAQRWAQLNARAAETHPDDLQRLQALQAVDDHLDGRRTLDSLASIGQGYRVLRVLQTLVRPGR